MREDTPRLGEYTLLCVPPERVHEFWSHVEAMIERSYYASQGDETPDETRDAVFGGEALLWIVWNEKIAKIAAAGTTKIIETSQGRICVLANCGGDDIRKWKAFAAALEKYAKREGCIKTRIYGRPGWQRMLAGYTTAWVTIEKAL